MVSLQSDQIKLCSGVYIGHNQMLTAAHCDDGDLSIGTDKGVTLGGPATRLGVDKEQDVALFYHPSLERTVQPAKLTCLPLYVGQEVEIAGNPYPIRWSRTWGKVAALNVEGYVVLDALIGPGSSGGPVYDSLGHVRGIVNAMIPVGAGPFTAVLPVRTFAFIRPSTTICKLMGR